MSDDRNERIRRVVEAVRRRPRAEREAWLKKACRDEADRMEVRVILAHLEEQVTKGPGADDFEALLSRTAQGDPMASDRFWQLVLEDLRVIAKSLLARERNPVAPETVSLVLRVVHQFMDDLPARNRRYFFGAARRAMQRIIIDAIRRSRTIDGGELLEQIESRTGSHDVSAEDLKQALDKLKAIMPRRAEVVWLRFVMNFSVTETAEALEIAERTVEADTAFARAWLHKELAGTGKADREVELTGDVKTKPRVRDVAAGGSSAGAKSRRRTGSTA